MSYPTERWVRIIGIGLAIWVVSVLFELALFPLENLSSLWYDSVLWLLFLLTAMTAATAYFPAVIGNRRTEGWIVGAVWLVIALGCDMGFHFAVDYKEFDILLYLSLQGWLYLQLPIVAVMSGILSQSIEDSHKYVPLNTQIFTGRR